MKINIGLMLLVLCFGSANAGDPSTKTELNIVTKAFNKHCTKPTRWWIRESTPYSRTFTEHKDEYDLGVGIGHNLKLVVTTDECSVILRQGTEFATLELSREF